MQRNRNSRIRGTFLLEESRIPPTTGIRNLEANPLTKNPESTAWIQNPRLSWIRLQGAISAMILDRSPVLTPH